MGIYIFEQMMKYRGDRVNDIRRYKECLFEEVSTPVKYVFTKIPEQKDVRKYEKVGIDIKQLVSMYQYFTDNCTLECSVKIEDKLDELKRSLHYTYANRMDTVVKLEKDGYVIATITVDENNKEYCREISYFSYTKLLRKEVYTNGVAYVDYYMTAMSENRLYAKETRRTFYNLDGSVAYDQLFENGKEWFLFPDGSIFTKQQFAMEFIKKLNLSEQDLIILDNSVPKEYMQAVFTFGKAAKIIVLAHVGQEGLKKQKAIESYLKGYFYEWFPYSELLDIMVVSTEEQKKRLIKELEEYHCSVPDIKVSSMDGTFDSTVLYESYDGNLALSWVFTGKTEGFLIYDEFGIKIYETNNAHQHYFEIKGYKKENGFVLKAYVDTIKGKMVVAESEPVYLSVRKFESQ